MADVLNAGPYATLRKKEANNMFFTLVISFLALTSPITNEQIKQYTQELNERHQKAQDIQNTRTSTHKQVFRYKRYKIGDLK